MKGLVGCLLLMGCQPTVIAGPDAAPVDDSQTPRTGLFVSWSASLGEFDAELNVSSATFKLSRIQAIGDNGGAIATRIDLTWNGETAPPVISMPDAPIGIYSEVTFDIDAGLADGYQINGKCRVSGNERDFAIRDTDKLSVKVDSFGVTLQPGAEVTLPIDVDLKDAIESIDYDNLSDVDGVLVLDADDSQMYDFRRKLKEAFKRGI